MKNTHNIFIIALLLSTYLCAQSVEEIKTTGAPANVSGITTYNNKLFFSGNGVLWSTDGTDAGTKMLNTCTLGFVFGKDADGYSSVFNGKLYFVASTNTDGKQLWVTDGTDAGTQQFKKFNSSGVNLRYFVEYNSKLYFLLDDGVHGLELWFTDGTSANTQMLKDINPTGNGFDYISNSKPADPSFTIMNNKLYFKANDGAHGLELWVTDGTDAGTQMVKDINSSGSTGAFNGKSSGRLGLFGVYNNNLYFASNDGVGSGYELWISDGTSAGTKKFLSKDGTTFFWVNNFTVFNNKLYFYGSASILLSPNNWVTQAGLWCTDGTVAGTSFIKEFNRIDGDNGFSDDTKMGSMRILDNKIYFAAAEPKDSQIHLWVSDGTTAGTVVVSKINKNGTSFDSPSVTSQTFVSTVFDNKLFFIADDGKGFDLFSSDGTAAGTVKVNSPAHTLIQQANAEELKVYNGSLYYRANYTDKADLWRVKGNTTNVENLSGNVLPAGFKLEQNYPNPFNPSTIIKYQLSEDGYVTLRVYDILGKEIATLVNEFKQAGNYNSQFSIHNSQLTSGIYFYTLRVNGYAETKKMILTK